MCHHQSSESFDMDLKNNDVLIKYRLYMIHVLILIEQIKDYLVPLYFRYFSFLLLSLKDIVKKQQCCDLLDENAAFYSLDFQIK